MRNDEQTYAIIGAAMEVHKTLGHGFLGAVYQEALAVEFTQRLIAFCREVELPVHCKGSRLDTGYRADFICYEKIIVELKALDTLSGRERAQVINYLKARGLSRALLLNFGSSSLQHDRLVYKYSVPLRESAPSADGVV